MSARRSLYHAKGLCTTSAGISKAQWTSTGTGVLTAADFNLRLAVWDLKGQTCRQLRGPKHSNWGIRYSVDGRLLAVAEVRALCKLLSAWFEHVYCIFWSDFMIQRFMCL
jgi:hypothetical protein